MLTLENIAHTYESPTGPVPALAPINLQVKMGDLVCIVGPSGCGKSTLLRIVAGLLAPTQGTVRLDGNIITSPQPAIAYVFQNANLMPWLSVLDNLALPLDLNAVAPETRRQRAADMIARMRLSGFERAYPAELSGGMAQRVAIGRALIQNPDVLLLDEPFGALDALTREQMQLELLNLFESDRKTALMVTHGITEAVFVADRVLVMSPRPGQFRADIPINLPRPRNLAMIHDPAFGALVQRIRGEIEIAI